MQIALTFLFFLYPQKRIESYIDTIYKLHTENENKINKDDQKKILELICLNRRYSLRISSGSIQDILLIDIDFFVQVFRK